MLDLRASAQLNTRNSTKQRLRRRLVEYLVFNLLALAWLLLGLCDLLSLLVGLLALFGFFDLLGLLDWIGLLQNDSIIFW